jgi:cellobiose-specific phosphotransferase system component IIA
MLMVRKKRPDKCEKKMNASDKCTGECHDLRVLLAQREKSVTKNGKSNFWWGIEIICTLELIHAVDRVRVA